METEINLPCITAIPPQAQGKKRPKLIDAKNMADILVYQIEKALQHLSNKVPASNMTRSKPR